MTSVESIEHAGLVELGVIDAERGPDGRPVEYLPQDRYENIAGLPLNPHGSGPFCRLRLPRLPRQPGVYAIVLGPQVVYVGECQNLADRFGPRGYGVIHPRNCFSAGQPTNCKINGRLLSLLCSGTTPCLWFAPEEERGRRALESELIAAIRPPWNTRA